MNGNGANSFSLEELEALFNADAAQETPPATEKTETQEDGKTETEDTGNTQNNVDTTKAFAKRLKESTDKAVAAERENIAKSLGYNSYEELQKSREKKVFEDNGLDESIVSPIVDELVKQRIDNDPRMKELASYREKQIQEFGRKELAELKELTGGKIVTMSQLSREVLDEWAKSGSLVNAYMKMEGANLVRSMRGEQNKGTTDHLQNPSGSNGAPSGKRFLTEDEKRVWKMFNPKMTDEELNKKTVDK
jgi:hypothetical protein